MIHIQFLNSAQGAKEYLKTSYFQQMSPKELLFRLKTMPQKAFENQKYVDHRHSLSHLRAYLQNCYTQLTLDWTPNEIKAIRHCFKCLEDKLKSRAENLIPNKLPIGLIKLSRGIDWNYPYTINHSIVLPQTFINSAVNTPTDFQSKIHTLCHELIHILQRNNELYPHQNIIFDFIYKNLWDFHKVNPSQIHFPNENDNLNLITNPDAYNCHWIMPIGKPRKWILPVLNLDKTQMPNNFMFELTLNKNNQYIVSQEIQPIENEKLYTQKFYGLTKQLSHPNEILAHLIAIYIIDNQILKESSNYGQFYNIINKYLINPNLILFKNL